MNQEGARHTRSENQSIENSIVIAKAEPQNRIQQNDLEIDEENEYSDEYLSSSEEEEGFDEDPTLFLTDVDQRNIGKPEYVPMIAEKCVVNAQKPNLLHKISTKDFREVQKTLTKREHDIALLWLFQVFQRIPINEDVLYHSVYYLNVTLCTRNTTYEELQLVAVVCLWLSLKMEKSYPIPLAQIRGLCPDDVTEKDMIRMEPIIIEALNYDLRCNSPLFFIHRFLDAIDAEPITRRIAEFFGGIAIQFHEFMDFTPTIIGLTSVCLAKLCHNEFCPKRRLFAYAHIETEGEFIRCGRLLMGYTCCILKRPKSSYREKYEGEDSFLSSLILDVSLLYQ